MSERVNFSDFEQFEDAKTAIIRDDDQYLVVKSVLASEIVQPYRDQKTGRTFKAYKPADELEKATLTFRGVPIKALGHPRGSHITDAVDANGRVENPTFRKDLNDPKTNRPCRRGIVGELWFYRDNALEVKTGNFTPITEAVAKSIRDGTLRDNSIGFSCFNDPSPGEWNGQKYDVVQRQIFGNHLAAPIERGRCPSPYCGINCDSEDEDIIIQDEAKGISYRFDHTKFSKDQAELWMQKRDFTDCPVCQRLETIGFIEAGKRLYDHYGPDVLEVIEGHDVPKDEDTPPPDDKDKDKDKDKNGDKPPVDEIERNRIALQNLTKLTKILP